MNLIVIVGITGSGKTKLALQKQKEYKNSIIISCDSRQVYKFSKLSSNIPNGVLRKYNSSLNAYYIEDTPHFLIDCIDPKEIYSLNNFLKDVHEILENTDNIETVILVGGTGLWAKAIIDNYQIHEYIDNSKFLLIKEQLSKLDISTLQQEINTNNNIILKNLNNSDKNNSKRLVNILANIYADKLNLKKKIHKKFKFKKIEVIITDNKVTKIDIENRLRERIKNGLIEELENLYSYLGYERMYNLGMQYKVFCDYKTKLIDKEDLFDLIVLREIQYQKRQKTWNKKYFS